MERATRGILASVGSSVLFGAIFYLAPVLAPLDANQLLAWRLAATIPAIALAFTLLKLWGDVVDVIKRLRAKPLLVLVLAADSMLLCIQLWLFGWGPQTGHGLDLALGFLLLPLAMVLVGVLIKGEKLSRLRITAVIFALIGVTSAVFVAGGIGWATLVVTVGYPIYFSLRGHFNLNSIGATGLEFGAMTPFAVFFLLQKETLDPVVTSPRLAGLVLLLGLLSAAGFLAYLQASRVLPLGLFGLLGYLEPLLLICVSILLLGEPFTTQDSFVYVPILFAIGLLVCEGISAWRRVTISKNK